MKILIVNWRDLSHPRSGGSEVYAQNLARIWAAGGNDVTYFCSAVAGKPEREKLDGYSILRRGGRLSVYRKARDVIGAAGRDGYEAILDIVNTRPFMTPRYADRVPAVALIYQTAEDVWNYEMPQPLARVGRSILEPRWLRIYADFPVLTISESSRESLERFGLRRVRVVPVGSELKNGPTGVRKEDTFTAIFVGRMAANKRPDHAVEAFLTARERLGSGQLWMVGDGPLLPKLQEAAPPGVTFFGYVDPVTKWNLMARSHVLLATSVREGWGMTVSEAAKLGTRSAGYDVPGLRDSISAARGILTPPEPAILANALALNASDWMAEEFVPTSGGTTSWEAVADAVLDELAASIDSRPLK